jgi:hypothetical protein
MGPGALRKPFQVYLTQVINLPKREERAGLTRGVFPTAPVKPSTATAFVANALAIRRPRNVGNMKEGEEIL